MELDPQIDHDQTNMPSGPHETHYGDEMGQINDEGHPNNDEIETNEGKEAQSETRPTRTRTQPSRFKDFVVQVPPSVKHPTSTSNQVTSMAIWRKIWSGWNLATHVSFPSFDVLDISMNKVVDLGCSRLNKVIHGVFQCGLWAIWKWRNKLVHASLDDRFKVFQEDIFPSIQRLSKVWISARCKILTRNLGCWISNPRSLLASL
nr:RNA-directed DNA polymerase, eukaryota, reverse transcriptase zinc-binding domain protein [Tanacetum cinerariifolium]